jgi:hypothetical protein
MELALATVLSIVVFVLLAQAIDRRAQYPQRAGPDRAGSGIRDRDRSPGEVT